MFVLHHVAAIGGLIITAVCAEPSTSPYKIAAPCGLLVKLS